MKVVSSEFTFGFAFLHEQANKYKGQLTAAPVLPSLLQEHDEGWDAKLPKLGAPYYYQFKLSEYMVGGRALEWDCYDSSYYRFDLYRRNRCEQHRRLRALSQQEPHVYYVAPEVETPEEFDDAYLDETVKDHSRLILLADCHDINDTDRHRISYRTGDAGFIQHSEPRHSGRSVLGRDLLSHYEEGREAWRPIDREFSVGVLNTVWKVFSAFVGQSADRQVPRTLEALGSYVRRHREDESLFGILAAAQYLLSALVGANLVIVGEPREEASDQ